MTDTSTASAPDRPADVLRKHLRINGLSHAADQPLVDAIAGAFAELHPEVALLRDGDELGRDDAGHVLTPEDACTRLDPAVTA